MKKLIDRIDRLFSSEAAKDFCRGVLEGFRYTVTN